MRPLITDLAAAYQARQPHVTFDIQGGGSRLGQSLVEAGEVDLGLVSWPPQHLAAGFRLAPIARDPIAVILHPYNRPQSFSLTQLRDIFAGRYLDWQELGGRAGPIQVVSREDGSGTRAAFEALVMEDQAVTPTAIVLPNSQAVVDFVAETPNAVGYVSLAFVEPGVYAIPIAGVEPTAEEYPLTRELSLILPAQGAPEATAFVEFALSPAGQAIILQQPQ
jgi:phosphate transport system substrate-binding protein